MPFRSCVNGLPFPKDLPFGALPLPLDLDGTIPGATVPTVPTVPIPVAGNKDSKPGIDAKLSSPGMELKELRSKLFKAPRLIFPRPKLASTDANGSVSGAGAVTGAGAAVAAGAAGIAYPSWPRAVATAAQPCK